MKNNLVILSLLLVPIVLSAQSIFEKYEDQELCNLCCCQPKNV